MPSREDPRDLLLARPDAFDESAPGPPLRAGSRVGTAAARRRAQLGDIRPDLELLAVLEREGTLRRVRATGPARSPSR